MAVVSPDWWFPLGAYDGVVNEMFKQAGTTGLADRANHALNLAGGGSTSLVCAGALRNVPREEHGVVLAGGRAVSTAVTFAR